MIVERQSRETGVRVSLALAPGPVTVDTGVRFLDHMLATLARYAQWTLAVSARGDLRHHLVEDVAITIGTAVERAAPPAVARFGHRVVPMDDALVAASLDLGGRRYYRGRLPSGLYTHWMRSFADAAGCTLHLEVRRGRDRHHVVEAAFKALGLALHDALAAAPEVFSTKGAVRLTTREVP
jgi:imidazoleglycerol-phosphate dehydratase